MTTIAKLQNLTTPVEINWSLMRDEKAVFTFECEPEPEIESESEEEETDFTTDVLQFQLDLMMKLKNKEITHEEGMKMLKETYPTVVSDDEEEEEEEEEEEQEEEDEKVCQACSYFVRYSNDLKQYKADVLQVLATLKEVASRPITQSIQFCMQSSTPHLQIQFTEGLHAQIPETKYLQYACGIVAFFVTITTFVDGDASITVSKDFVSKCPQPLLHLTTLRNALRVSLINQNKTDISTFRMKEDGTIYSWLNVRTDDRAIEYLINHKYSRENGFFELDALTVTKGEKEIKALDAEHPYYISSNDTGRMLGIRIVGTPRFIPVDDVLWRRNYETELQRFISKKL